MKLNHNDICTKDVAFLRSIFTQHFGFEGCGKLLALKKEREPQECRQPKVQATCCTTCRQVLKAASW